MLIVRPAADGDIAFVLDSFVADFRRSVYADGLPRARVRDLMVRYLTDPAYACSVLCDSDEPTEIIGYVVWRDAHAVIWVHVKGLYRRHQMARHMLAAIGVSAPTDIKTPFVPSPKQCRDFRSRGWRLQHRPWL